MKLDLHSIGCRLNQSEIETLFRQLAACGHELVADEEATSSDSIAPLKRHLT